MSDLLKYAYNEDGVPQFYTGCDHPIVESASPSEILSAALELEGAQADTAIHVHDFELDMVAVNRPGRYAVIPILEEET